MTTSLGRWKGYLAKICLAGYVPWSQDSFYEPTCRSRNVQAGFDRAYWNARVQACFCDAFWPWGIHALFSATAA